VIREVAAKNHIVIGGILGSCSCLAKNLKHPADDVDRAWRAHAPAAAARRDARMRPQRCRPSLDSRAAWRIRTLCTRPLCSAGAPSRPVAESTMFDECLLRRSFYFFRMFHALRFSRCANVRQSFEEGHLHGVVEHLDHTILLYWDVYCS